MYKDNKNTDGLHYTYNIVCYFVGGIISVTHSRNILYIYNNLIILIDYKKEFAFQISV